MLASSRTLRVGLGQMHVEAGEPEQNMRVALAFVGKAASEHCDILVLPECLDLGWTDPSAQTQAQPISGPRSELLCAAARHHSMHLVAGLTELAEGSIYNTAILVNDHGEILAKHRKINILDIASHLYTKGQNIGMVQTKLGKVGISICADLLPESNDLGHALGAMGAEIILSPCSWAVPPDFDQQATPYGQEWKESYSAIAAKYGIPVIGVSNTGGVKDGAWAGWQCIGSSLVVQPGRATLQYPYTSTDSRLHTVDIVLPSLI